MTTLVRTVHTTTSPQAAYALLSDFSTAVRWDSGTVSCTLTSGDGGVGSVWHNVSEFAGRTIDLDYTKLADDGSSVLVYEGANDTTTSHDTITITPEDQGCSVEYHAEFSFRGAAKLMQPVLTPLLDKLGDATAETLQQALDALPRDYGQPAEGTAQA